MELDTVRLLIVVENADYRAALSNIFMPEQLYEQLSGWISPVDTHILTAAVAWSNTVQEVAIFSCYSDQAYSDRTYLNVRIMGSGMARAAQNNRELVRLVADFCPTHLVLCTQSLALTAWAVRNKVQSLALLSDWQAPLGWAEQRQHAKYIRQLNHSRLSWVGGHGLPACKILAASGVDPAKVIPWEWSQPQLLQQYPPKKIRSDNAVIQLVYVGPLTPEAGIDDLLQGTVLLQKSGQRNGYTVSLQLICNTLTETAPVALEQTIWLQEQVQTLALGDAVTVRASVPPEQLLAQVRLADIAVIPAPGPASPKHHPKLPLGLALAMAARTPIVACDHPELAVHLYHGANAIVFPMGSPESMAHRIERVMGQSALYAQLSEASQMTLDTFKVPARWAALIDLWMNDSAYDRQRLCDFALSSGRYDLAETNTPSLTRRVT